MSQVLICKQGHSWNWAQSASAGAQVIPRCPACGSPGKIAEPTLPLTPTWAEGETLAPTGPAQKPLDDTQKQEAGVSEETILPAAQDKTEEDKKSLPWSEVDIDGDTLPPGSFPPSYSNAKSKTIAPIESTLPFGQGKTLSRSGDQVDIPGYEILGVLGRGGMGVVYKARQIRLNRVVALKMTLAGSQADSQDLARFRIEGEAVARLQHPNIVQIYEVGENAGHPYFSLEFVEGGSLDKVIKNKPLASRPAAELVEKLAQAMFAAHQRGIIHRDLKPANILLTADGQPKITDFGLAKNLDEDKGQTRAGAIMGTPSYMAPEQASGKVEALGTPADIYSLGAILYDVLTGRPPFVGQTVMDTLTQVQTAEPVRLTRLQAGVPVDLETICLKCLEKDPAKRYPSARDLADDLHRFLVGEPILARPTPPWERVLKWGRRRPAAAALVLMGAATIVGLGTGGPIVAWHFRRLADEETGLRQAADQARTLAENESKRAEENFRRADENFQQAEENFQQVQKAMDQLTEVGQQRLANVPGMEIVREEMLSQALGFYRSFLSKKTDNPGVRWQSGRAYQRVGDIQALLGKNGPARGSYDQARLLFEGLVNQFPDEPKYREDLAACQNNLGNLLRETNDIPGARQAYDAALTLRKQLESQYPTVWAYRQGRAASFNNLGNLLQESDPAAAENAYRQALDLQQVLAREVPADPTFRHEEARSYNNLGTLLGDAGRLGEAKMAVLQARDLLEQLLEHWPDVVDYQRDLAVAYDHFGSLLKDTDPSEADKAYRRSLELSNNLIQKFPMVPLYQQDHAAADNNLSILLLAEGRSKEATSVCEEALNSRKILADHFPKPDYQFELAKSYTNWAIVSQTQYPPEKIQKVYDNALAGLTSLVQQFPGRAGYAHELARTTLNLGNFQVSTGQFPLAEKSYRQALEILTRLVAGKSMPEYEQELGRSNLNLGILQQKTGHLPEAEQAFTQAADHFTRLVDHSPEVPEYRYDLAVSALSRGNLLRITHRLESAEPILHNAVEILTKLEADLPERPAFRQQLARAEAELAIFLGSKGGRTDEASALFLKALALLEKLTTAFPDRPDYRQDDARTCNNLGILLTRANRKEEAKPNYQKAVTLLKDIQSQFPSQPEFWRDDLIDGLTNLASLLAKQGPRQEEEAMVILRQAIELQRNQVAAAPDVLDFQVAMVRNLNDMARLLQQHNQSAEASQLLQEALRLQQAVQAGDPKDATYRDAVLVRAEALTLLGEHVKAARLVTTLAHSAPPGWPEAPRAAGILAGCVQLARLDPEVASEALRRQWMESYGDQAILLLQEALNHGFNDVNYLQSPVFQPLRQRKDFQALLASLDKTKTAAR